MIADPKVELVDIATRSADHCQHAIMALEAGKYVFLEKPICVSYDEAQRLQAAAGTYPGTPGETFGTPETLSWIEQTVAVRQGNNDVLWDHLYKAIREGQPFPIKLAEAMDVMRIISSAKR